jgi:hypothetical protein
LSVEQRGSTYVLTGYDDHCGAPVRGAVSGTAHFNPDGSLGMGFTVLRPDGRAIPTSATLSLATVSGTWADAYGNSGDFVFNPPGSAGEPRRITLKGSYAIQFQPTAGGQNGTATISFGEALDAEPTAVTANFITGSAVDDRLSRYGGQPASGARSLVYLRTRSAERHQSLHDADGGDL